MTILAAFVGVALSCGVGGTAIHLHRTAGSMRVDEVVVCNDGRSAIDWPYVEHEAQMAKKDMACEDVMAKAVSLGMLAARRAGEAAAKRGTP